MSEMSDKLELNRELPRHLRELGILLGRPVSKEDLLSLHETRELRDRTNKMIRSPVVKFHVPFVERLGPKFHLFIRRLFETNPTDVYIWTPASNLCGVHKPVALKAVEIGFPFLLNPEGIVVFVSVDFCDQLLLDFSTDSQREELLEVEASGDHWGHVSY